MGCLDSCSSSASCCCSTRTGGRRRCFRRRFLPLRFPLRRPPLSLPPVSRPSPSTTVAGMDISYRFPIGGAKPSVSFTGWGGGEGGGGVVASSRVGWQRAVGWVSSDKFGGEMGM